MHKYFDELYVIKFDVDYVLAIVKINSVDCHILLTIGNRTPTTTICSLEKYPYFPLY